jgi:hypothetical protein
MNMPPRHSASVNAANTNSIIRHGFCQTLDCLRENSARREIGVVRMANAQDQKRGKAPSALIALLGCLFKRKQAFGLRVWPTHAYVQYEKA